jgi:hypothetical protein
MRKECGITCKLVKQLPTPATRWQHVFGIHYATYILYENDSATTEAREKNKTIFGILPNLEIISL